MVTQYSPHTNVIRPNEEGRLLVSGSEQMAQLVSDLHLCEIRMYWKVTMVTTWQPVYPSDTQNPLVL